VICFLSFTLSLQSILLLFVLGCQVAFLPALPTSNDSKHLYDVLVATWHKHTIPVQILVNPGHGTAGVNSGIVPAVPEWLATLAQSDPLLQKTPILTDFA